MRVFLCLLCLKLVCEEAGEVEGLLKRACLSCPCLALMKVGQNAKWTACELVVGQELTQTWLQAFPPRKMIKLVKTESLGVKSF